MKMTYFTGIKGLEPKSIEVCRKNLLQELKKVLPDFKYQEYTMKPPIDLDIPLFHLDRTFNRFILYQFAALKHYSQINHVLDHTYACALNLLPKNVKKIATVHDLNLSKGLLNGFRFFSVPGLRKADKIIAVSKSTKNDLVTLLKIPEEKIKVIYNGVDHKLFKQKDTMLKSKLKLTDKKIILNVANHEKRKNTAIIVKSLNILLKKYSNLVLIRVGQENKETLDLVNKLNLEEKVLYFENISDEHLVNLYNIADIFVSPSFYEGFGLPVLEAMACGCPVVCSNTTSLPEVAGNAAIMVNPYDVDSLAKATEKVLSEEILREEMIEKGLEQAKKFSWQKAAEETLKVYETVFNEH